MYKSFMRKTTKLKDKITELINFMDTYHTFNDRKTQQCQDVSSSSQTDLQIQCNTDQNPSKLFLEYWKTNSEFIRKGRRPRITKSTAEGKNWRTDTIQLQNLL